MISPLFLANLLRHSCCSVAVCLAQSVRSPTILKGLRGAEHRVCLLHVSTCRDQNIGLPTYSLTCNRQTPLKLSESRGAVVPLTLGSKPAVPNKSHGVGFHIAPNALHTTRCLARRGGCSHGTVSSLAPETAKAAVLLLPDVFANM